MYLAIRVDAIEAFSCLSYRTKKLRIWVIFFFTEKFFGYFFWNFSFCFLIGWKQNCSFCYLTTASDSSWNFRSRFIIWNSEIMRENMFFDRWKSKKNVYFEKKSVSLRYSRKSSELFLISCSWVIWTEQKRKKRHGKELFFIFENRIFQFLNLACVLRECFHMIKNLQ